MTSMNEAIHRQIMQNYQFNLFITKNYLSRVEFSVPCYITTTKFTLQHTISNFSLPIQMYSSPTDVENLRVDS